MKFCRDCRNYQDFMEMCYRGRREDGFDAVSGNPKHRYTFQDYAFLERSRIWPWSCGKSGRHFEPMTLYANETAQAKRPLSRAVLRLRCWWYGHEQHPQDSAPPESATCMHCGDYIPYGDMVGDTRHNRTMDWLHHWMWRRWMPAKCPACGARFGHRRDCDGLPF